MAFPKQKSNNWLNATKLLAKAISSRKGICRRRRIEEALPERGRDSLGAAVHTELASTCSMWRATVLELIERSAAISRWLSPMREQRQDLELATGQPARRPRRLGRRFGGRVGSNPPQERTGACYWLAGVAGLREIVVGADDQPRRDIRDLRSTPRDEGDRDAAAVLVAQRPAHLVAVEPGQVRLDQHHEWPGPAAPAHRGRRHPAAGAVRVRVSVRPAGPAAAARIAEPPPAGEPAADSHGRAGRGPGGGRATKPRTVR